MSNDDWEHPHDPDAKIGKMKDGTTKMSYKPEIVEDLETGAVIDVELHPGDEGDSTTGKKTLDNGIEEMFKLCETDEFQVEGEIEVVADKGYHNGRFLRFLDKVGIKSCIAEPDRGRRKWTNNNGVKTPEKADEQRVVYKNRNRIRSEKGKKYHTKRAEIVERCFQHILDSGGMRRTTLRGNENILKRLLIHVAAFNLSLILRKALGAGKPRCFNACLCQFFRSIFLFIVAYMSIFALILRQKQIFPSKNNYS
ncbi:MAG: transposase [Kosmotogaceae bacterium]